MLKIALHLPDGVREVVLELPGGELAVDPLTLATRVVGGRQGRPLSPPDVASLVTEFIAHLATAEDLKPQTLDGYRKRLGQFARWLEATGCDPAKPATWTAYYATLKARGLSPFTRKGHYDRLRRFGRWLAATGHLMTNPMDSLEPPRLPRRRLPKAIPRAVVRSMLAAATEPRDRALLLLLRDSGGRAAEIVGARWGDVDWAGRRVAVVGKGDKARWLRFRPVTAEALESYRAMVPHGAGDPLWWGLKGPLSVWGLRHILKRLAARAGVGGEPTNPHAWRHAFGRDTTKAGIPTAQLQDLMGHSSIEVTKIYAQFDESDLDEAHDRYSPVDEDVDPLPDQA